MNHKLNKLLPDDALALAVFSALTIVLSGCAATADYDQKPAASVQQDASPSNTAEVKPASDYVVVPNQPAQAEPSAAAAQTEQSDAHAQELVMQLSQLGAVKSDQGMMITLSDKQFSPGQASLRPKAVQGLNKLAALFVHHPELKASIDGYSDNSKKFDANLDLSMRRANAVKSALVGLGVSAECLTPRAYGQIGALDSNSSAEGRLKNRRVQIVFDVNGNHAAM
jgi:outer membrane protein OmpA-like peptidoglycan-associated protein